MILFDRLSILRITLVSITLVLLFLTFSLQAKTESKKVLLVSSYHPGFPTFFNQIDGIKSVFDSKNVDLEVEFMDSKRFIGKVNEAHFYNYLKYKISHYSAYDAVITTDDNALNFLLSYYDSLFCDIPVVFCGVNNIETALDQNKNPLFTGVIEAVSMHETLELMVQLFPQTDTIYSITDNTTSSLGDVKTYYSLSNHLKEVVFSEVSLQDITFSQFERRLKDIGNNTPVLLLSAYCDKTGQTMDFSESLELIKENLNSPLFHLWYHGIGEGVLGGKLISHFEQARVAAEMVCEILAGNSTPLEKVVDESPNLYVFDYNELKAFDLHIKDLPKSSTIVNKPDNFFSKYKFLILGVLSILFFLVGFIILLSINIFKRKKIEVELFMQNKEYFKLNEEFQVQNDALLASLKKLRETEDKFKVIIEQAEAGIVVVDMEGRIVLVNPGFVSISGVSESKLIDRNILEIGTDDQNEFFQRCVKSNKNLESIRSKIINTDKKEVLIEIFWKHINVNDEPFMFGTLRDVTEKEKYQRELKLAKERAEQSNKLKTEFIHNMSHEVRTPMNGIIGFTEFLFDDGISSTQRIQYARVVQNSGIQLLRIIDDILEISSLETKQVPVINEKVCINDLILEQFNLFENKAKEQNLSLFISSPLGDKASTVIVDRSKVIKIISNLLENALKFTNKGYIELGYALVEDKTILELYVKDTGIGISKEKHDIIFERFSQAEKELSKKVNGLGLGLSIAKENAELIGGSICLDSEVDKGTTFRVRIPFNPVHKDFLQEVKSVEKTKKRHKILIAEDEEVNFLYLKILLGKHVPNYSAVHAKNGKEAVEMALDDDSIGIVFMDIKMPIMNGIEATKKIKESRKDIIIVAQTAYSSEKDRQMADEAGFDGFLSKPIDKNRLKGILLEYLGG